jgi:hypothetical protein
VTNPPIRNHLGNWTKNNEEKVGVFALHLSKVFKPWDLSSNITDQNEIENLLSSPNQLDLPINFFRLNEVKNIIKYDIDPNKSPGFDLISGKVLKELPLKCYQLLTYIYNAILHLKYFPTQWKVSQIIMILKPGKEAEKAESYRPISLLPILSKVFEKLLLLRLNPIIEDRAIIPKHQFGFRCFHSTIEQVHRIVNEINRSFEEKKCCSAVL